MTVFVLSFNGEQSVINGNANNPLMELRDQDGDGGTPYIDFSNDPTTDFDVRIILTGMMS